MHYEEMRGCKGPYPFVLKLLMTVTSIVSPQFATMFGPSRSNVSRTCT